MKQETNRNTSQWMLYGLSLGLIFGTALGNGALGLIFGMLIGILIDAFRNRNNDE